MYTSASTKTLELIAKIFHTQQSNFSVKYLNGSRQAGSTDCGLYTIAAITCSLLGKDSTKVVFDQRFSAYTWLTFWKSRHYLLSQL